MKIIALMSVFNEERYIASVLRHSIEQGLLVYLINNSSTDRTEEIARTYLGRGLVGIETLPRPDGFDLPAILQRETELAFTLDGDWFVHLDADEFLVSGHAGLSLRDIFRDADRRGFNAIHFMEYVFVPTREHPTHEHDRFLETMRWYYPFLPRTPHRLIAWKRQRQPVDLVTGAGHAVAFPGLRTYPRWPAMKHYVALSHEHACHKWVAQTFSPSMQARGWSTQRRALTPDQIGLPSEKDLREYRGDADLDPSFPRAAHLLFRPGS